MCNASEFLSIRVGNLVVTRDLESNDRYRSATGNYRILILRFLSTRFSIDTSINYNGTCLIACSFLSRYGFFFNAFNLSLITPSYLGWRLTRSCLIDLFIYSCFRSDNSTKQWCKLVETLMLIWKKYERNIIFSK